MTEFLYIDGFISCLKYSPNERQIFQPLRFHKAAFKKAGSCSAHKIHASKKKQKQTLYTLVIRQIEK